MTTGEQHGLMTALSAVNQTSPLCQQEELIPELRSERPQEPRPDHHLREGQTFQAVEQATQRADPRGRHHHVLQRQWAGHTADEADGLEPITNQQQQGGGRLWVICGEGPSEHEPQASHSCAMTTQQ